MSISVSVLIKALNEGAHIRDCLASVLPEVQALGGEVILVDSCSSDDTVAIARTFPVRIVQFRDCDDRGCAAAVQLGYQHARAPFVYVMDGDMQLQPGFLAQALARLQADSTLAGVGGQVVDRAVRTLTDARRQRRVDESAAAAEVSSLGGGGLYRRDAIASSGYLAHRGLPANEEAELGARLQAGGWRLLRLPTPAVLHDGHVESNLAMMRRLWRGRRFQSSGMFLRSAWRKPWFARSLKSQRHVFYAPVLDLGLWGIAWVLSHVGQLAAGPAWLIAIVLVMSGLRWKTGSWQAALWSLVAWHMFALGALVGLCRTVADPLEPIPAVVLKEWPAQASSETAP